MLALFIGWIIFGCICGFIGNIIMKSPMGFILGLLFGVFGLIVAAILATKQQPPAAPVERPYRHIPKKPKQKNEEFISARELRMRARAFRDLNYTVDTRN